MQMAKAHGPEVDSFLAYDDKDLQPYASDDTGKKSINPAYTKHLGRTPFGHEFESIKKHLSTKKWKDSIGKVKLPEEKKEQKKIGRGDQ